MKSQQFIRDQSGSAIFIILVGIALFVALAMAISQSLRVSGNAPTKNSKESMDLQYIQVAEFLDTLKLRYTKLTVVDKVPVLKLSFKNDVYKNVDGSEMCTNNNAACTDATCAIYSPYAPDGVRPELFTNIANATSPTAGAFQANGTVLVMQMSVAGVGTSASDFGVRIFGVSPEFCNFYNAKQGLTTTYTDSTTLTSIGETPGTSQGNIWGACVGNAAWGGTDTFGDEATMFNGKSTFCAPGRLDAAQVRLSITYILQAR